tara:strand:- start:759 stop:1019 length:261 start_codon:yes stop_codon:yes gene_type:complete
MPNSHELQLNQETSPTSSQEKEATEGSLIEPQEKPSATTTEVPSFGWSSYAERMNGRFAMIGFFAILIVEIISKNSSFLHWAGLVK